MATFNEITDCPTEDTQCHGGCSLGHNWLARAFAHLLAHAAEENLQACFPKQWPIAQGESDVHGESFICSDISRLIKPRKSATELERKGESNGARSSEHSGLISQRKRTIHYKDDTSQLTTIDSSIQSLNGSMLAQT